MTPFELLPTSRRNGWPARPAACTCHPPASRWLCLGVLLVFVTGTTVCFPGDAAAQEALLSAKRRSGQVGMFTDSGAVIARYEFYRDSLVVLRDPHGGTVQLHPAMFAEVLGRYGKFHQEDSSRIEVGFRLRDGNLRVYFEHRSLVILVASLLLLVLTVALVLLHRARRSVREARRERERLIEQRRLAELGREEERRRLARELHDGPLQELYALRFGLASVTASAEEHDALLLGVTDDLRRLTDELRSPPLAEFGLGAALRSLSLRYEERWGLQATVDVQGDDGIVPESQGRALFRVAQEAASNAARHGDAARITLRLRVAEGRAALTVEDDGKGFEVPRSFEGLAARGHYGLLGQQERVAIMNGTLQIDSDIGRGTRVHVVLPLEEPTHTRRSPTLRRRLASA